MIPISDDNPTRIVPFLTWGIMALCIAVFLWQVSQGAAGGERAAYTYGFVPALLLGDARLNPALEAPAPVLTLFTSMFMHGSWLHLAGNMLYLWIFGNNVEDVMGHIRFLIFYLLCGVAAALTHGYANPDSTIPMVGASGAISGVLASYVLVHPGARVTVILPLGVLLYPMKIAAVFVVGFWFLIQLVSAAMTDPGRPGVAFLAHVGGFVAGLILTPFFKYADVPLFGRRRGPWG
ncbi:MAG: rhomboid family intramembrane serine protease [Alphaproteobacteria bacterium]